MTTTNNTAFHSILEKVEAAKGNLTDGEYKAIVEAVAAARTESIDTQKRFVRIDYVHYVPRNPSSEDGLGAPKSHQFRRSAIFEVLPPTHPPGPIDVFGDGHIRAGHVEGWKRHLEERDFIIYDSRRFGKDTYIIGRITDV
jgi:hypothetical protein